MAKCALCGGRADEEDKCYGCGVYICEHCDKTSGILGPHEFIDHSKTNLFLSSKEDTPSLQKQRLDEAWEKGKKAQASRFSRGAKAGRIKR